MTGVHVLELTEEELAGLWALLTMLDLQHPLDPPEKAILDKVQRLMES